MEVFLYNSTVCRLCGEENDHGTFLYSTEENNQNISELVNAYMPIKVCDDGQLPRTICPGCTIQLEATVEFINLIINGQKVIRALHQREIEYKKTVLNSNENEQDTATDNVVSEVNIENGAYQPEHAISLQVAGIDKPKRKRGRPPKKHKSPEELAEEAAAKEREIEAQKQEKKQVEPTGKRKRKTPTRFKEVVQGKELEKIFKEEGMTDGEDSEPDVMPDIHMEVSDPVLKVPEVIGHTDSGELVVIIKGKGRGRPKGRVNQKRQKCDICDKEFFCSGRYMSHIAQHGPVTYECQECSGTFPTRVEFNKHQEETGHVGQYVITLDESGEEVKHLKKDPEKPEEPDLAPVDKLMDNVIATTSLPVLNEEPESGAADVKEVYLKMPDLDATESETVEVEAMTEGSSDDKSVEEKVKKTPAAKVKTKLSCPHCDRMFSSKQSKSMHIKARHKGERPYSCGECNATFAYPRALALHAFKHRSRTSKGYACDLCGKVLNHPSSVKYHKEAVHAGHRFVCNKCGKAFKHKQLLQRHQLVHTQHRPYTCKLCNATFKTKANLMNHQLLHSGIKRYSCEQCKQKFAHKTSLTLHMRWHNGQKPYVCKSCGKAFSQKGNLSEHARIHTGEKPFHCAHCPRRFTTSSQHRLHMRRHANKDKMLAATPEPAVAVAVAPPALPAGGVGAGSAVGGAGAGGYKCGWCARTCLTRWTLAKHVRRHTGERPFKCPHCQRAFADCSNLNKHKKQVHKQVSLLANQRPPAAPQLAGAGVGGGGGGEGAQFGVLGAALEERVIYVTYDVDEDAEPAYHLVDPEQGDLEQVLTHHDLYTNEAETEPTLVEPTVQEHMAVTDEQGNPLHFTMQDGTQLAITSLDGQSLQVITQDGQTIPVEINGFTSDDTSDIQEITDPDTIVHELDIQKSDDEGVCSPVTHYYTIV